MVRARKIAALADRLPAALKKRAAVDPLDLVRAASLEEIDALGRKRKTALHCACEKERSDVVAALVARGAALSPHGPRGQTPLHVAASRRDADSLRLLLAAGADARAVDEIGESALHTACHWSALECAALLLDHANAPAADALGPYGRSPLSLACWGLLHDEESALGLLTLLLGRGASVDGHDTSGQSPTHFACNARMRRVARFVAERRSEVDESGLLAAVGNEYFDVAEALLERTGGAAAYAGVAAAAFTRAGLIGSVPTCEWVLARWPEVPVRERAVSEKPLERAVIWGNVPVVDYLLGLGVPPQYPSTGVGWRSPLEYALMHRKWEMVPRLIAHGATLDAASRERLIAGAPAEIVALFDGR